MMRCFLKPKKDALKGAKKALKLKKSSLKPKNDDLKMKGNAKKVTLKIHSLAKFTALKYLRRTQNATRRPGRATATSPGQSDQGERHPGGEAHPERTPLEGAKAHSVCFFAFALCLSSVSDRWFRAQSMRAGYPGCRLASLTLPWASGSLPRWGAPCGLDSFNVKMFRSSDVQKFRSSEEGF